MLCQKRSDRWQDKKYIPAPTPWLNQRRWLDDPGEMKSYSKKEIPAREIIQNYFQGKKDSSYIDSFYSSTYKDVYEIIPEENESQLAENIIRLFDWLETNREADLKNTITSLTVLEWYCNWLGNQAWIDSKSAKLLSHDNFAFKKFIDCKSKEFEYNIMTGM